MATDPDGPEWPNPPWSTLLLRRLLENSEFRITFLNRFADLLNTNFLPSEIKTIISRSKSVISPEIDRHLLRWKLDPNRWEPKVSKLDNYANLRLGYMRMYLSRHFELEGMVQVGINIPDPECGSIRLNSVSIDQPEWWGAYFKNIPIKLTAEAHTGWRFDHWSGTVQSGANPLIILPAATMTITAHFIRDSSVVINEINYNSSPLFEVGDWVEFINSGHETIDMSGWQFRDEDDLHVFEFPVNTILGPDSLLVICNDSRAFNAAFPDVEHMVGEFNFGLSGAGELIRLFDSAGNLVDSLTYDDVAPWPIEPDGQGATLALSDPRLDNSYAEGWFASDNYGTPGKENIITAIFGMIINETVPEHFSMGPAYPNPFNPIAQIPVHLPKAVDLRIMVYDINGRRIATLYDGHMDAGRHIIDWRPTASHASGIYFFILRSSSGYEGSEKLILIK